MTDAKRKKMEDLIYKFFDAMDKSGTNTKKYKELFQPMTNAQFDKWFKGFFANENAYLILDICEFENSVTLEDVEKGAKVLGIPLFEDVYMPHLSMDKQHVVVTKEPVPVGYLNIKRTQQTVSKKNGLSTEISKRSALTNQVTGTDKNGRQSDLENSMLVSLGLENTLKELNGPRADDMVMKQQMLQDIALNGYVRLSDLESDVDNKTTLNTVNVFLLGMGLNSDLVTTGLMTSQTVKREL